MVKTAIIILHYKDDKMTNQCVESVIANTDGAYTIIVVDNNSPCPYSSDKDIVILRNDNHYSVSGMNFGFMYALYELKADFVVNFDNDVRVLGNWLPPLLKVMEDKTVGIAGGKQWTRDCLFHREVGADFAGNMLLNLPDKQCDIVWIQGSAVIMRGDMMRKIGVHDERYKIICSDTDYCFHALDRGWRVVFTPDSEVIHFGSASYGGVPVETDSEDKQEFIAKWFGIKFTEMMKNFPLDFHQKAFGVAEYKVVKR